MPVRDADICSKIQWNRSPLAWIEGSIAEMSGQYIITLKAVNCQNGAHRCRTNPSRAIEL